MREEERTLVHMLPETSSHVSLHLGPEELCEVKWKGCSWLWLFLSTVKW